MVQECESLAKCGFFKKYETTKDLVCKGFIIRYCSGPPNERMYAKEISSRTWHTAI